MPKTAHENRAARIPSTNRLAGAAPSRQFQGFAAPTSNVTYCPNQFFDVCLPHYSRGVVRLVAYMIRKTLGWCDADGNPQEDQVLVSYQDLVTHAGISRDMIRRALNEAIEGHFIRCVRTGTAKASSVSGHKGLYELCWDGSGEYIKDPDRFQGFFEGEGNRTDIPNEFFDRVIPHESLAVIKVVGSIIRFSIGFQARRGRRRQQVKLSYRDIQRYARVRSSDTLTQALKSALRKNYVTRLYEGYFDCNAGRLSRAAVYGLRWADHFGTKIISQKNEAGKTEPTPDDQSEIRSGIGQKNEVEDRSEKRSGIEIKQRNETLKQQAEPEHVVANECYELLKGQGFDSKTASALAEKYPKTVIEEQIRWLPARMPRRNPLGMLRRAIEENWPDPAKASRDLSSPGAEFAAHFYAALAGNDGEPATEPSARDAALAERYLEKLRKLAKGPVDPADWGRAFGSIIREDFPVAARDRFSLWLALQLRGDRFFLRRQAAQKMKRLRDEGAAREAHEVRFRPDWLDYLRREEQRVKSERPEDYACFEAHRANERRRMIESPFRVFTEERLARYDAEGRRIVDFQTYFKSEVLNFWDWDTQMNPNRLVLPSETQ